MRKSVLIADPREVVRAGLSAIFQDIDLVSEVKDATTSADLKKSLTSFDTDLIVVSQVLVPDIKILPRRKFILLVDEPDFDMMMDAYEHEARGYFSVNVTADLLRATLTISQHTFLVDPLLHPWMMELIAKMRKRSDDLDLLSPREREVMNLLDKGIDRHSIAAQLHISEATLKTHIKNITRKHEDSQWSKEVLTYQRHLSRSQK